MIQRALDENRLDGRNRWVRTMRAIADELAEDMGGWGKCSTARKILIDRVAFKALICASIEGWVIRQGGPIEASGELQSALRKNGYGSYSASLARDLTALGLDPSKADKLPNLEDYLRARAEQPGAEGSS